MNLDMHFDQLLRDHVNLNKGRLEELSDHVAAIEKALYASDELDDLMIDTIRQGSWTHRTIIRPPSGEVFDADILIQIAEQPEWNNDPHKYADAVWKAVENHPTYGPMSERKNRCVRITYANFCQVDLVPYVEMPDGSGYIVYRTDNTFEAANPVGLTHWIQTADDITNKNLRKVLRLLKYLRTHLEEFDIKSVLLTVLLGERVYPIAAALDCYEDVPTTLYNLVADLARWLNGQTSKPDVEDPSCPDTDFNRRWTNRQFEEFRKDINELNDRIAYAYTRTSPHESINAWQQIFGLAFPSELKAPPSATAKTAKTLNSAPNEEFIENRFRVNETETVKAICEVLPPRAANRGDRRRLRARGGHVTKQRELVFKMVSTTVTAPFDVYWKVRNNGPEAVSRGQLRGEILPDQGHHERVENTLYSGHHYVECYIVKNQTCVARTRVSVDVD
ncbi:cyclic GMP-AMP synthase DncV-like nucleotidyltransferase [Nakamurella sp. A5-74]|uniref:Cyclic GMP-AMP synthase DncV-like nucleotidyltransferase n=1 Tax=Nakamurella sp. A5-74 TaxID=3158264 RepID=A0AAU8DP87_9ACTN